MSILDDKLIIFGPCTLESWQQIRPIIAISENYNLPYVRAPLFKPRTHPDSFQGLGQTALPILEEMKSRGRKLVSEVLSTEQLLMVRNLIDIVQVGARNMQNFELLKDIGKNYGELSRSPQVLLKRGFANTYEEWINGALYLERYGVPKDKIILCERGTRNGISPTGVTLDFIIALKAKNETAYKVIIDPSHGSKDSQFVLPLAIAALSLGFDGLMIEVHPRPQESVSDKDQALSTDEFENFLKKISEHDLALQSQLLI